MTAPLRRADGFAENRLPEKSGTAHQWAVPEGKK